MTKAYLFLRGLMLPLSDIYEYTPSSGKITELGCGQGVISAYLANNKKRNILGVDINKKRLPKISKKNLHFKTMDITKDRLPNSNAFVMSDVLHHMNFKQQKKVLKNIYTNLSMNGILIIKEIDTGELIRSKLSRLWDFMFYPNEKIYFNNATKLSVNLKKLGFSVFIKRPCRLFPGSTTLLICKKL